MNYQYVYAESRICPSVLEIGITTVYIRQNIQSVVRRDNNDDQYTLWTYEEAMIPIAEFNKHSFEILLSYQIAGNSAQLDMMEAIADLSTMVMEGGVYNG